MRSLARLNPHAATMGMLQSSNARGTPAMKRSTDQSRYLPCGFHQGLHSARLRTVP